MLALLDQADRRRTVVHAFEEKLLFFRVSDVRLDQQTVRFRVDLLHHRLERIKCACFCYLDIHGELRDNVFCGPCQNMCSREEA